MILFSITTPLILVLRYPSPFFLVMNFMPSLVLTTSVNQALDSSDSSPAILAWSKQRVFSVKFSCDFAVNKNDGDAKAAVLARDRKGDIVDGPFKSLQISSVFMENFMPLDRRAL